MLLPLIMTALADRLLFQQAVLQTLESFSREEKIELLGYFWPAADHSSPDGDYEAFFQHISDTLSELRPYADSFAFTTFGQLFDVVKALREHEKTARDELAGKLQSKIFTLHSIGQIIKSMELAVRLWLGLNVRFSSGFIGVAHARRGYLNWKADESLSAMAESHFNKTANTAHTGAELEELTAAKLKRVCLFHIEWTDCLNDHLKLTGRRGNRSLYLYQQKKCLDNHEKSGSPIPGAVLDEAIRSLEILLPYGDSETTKLLADTGKRSLRVPVSPPKEQSLYIDDFVYWKPQLLRLLELLRGTPETLLQRLFDTRDIGQWAGLWVGIFGILVLTLLFGVLSTIYAIKQYYLAIDSYQLSVKAYELSLILACEQNATMLPGLCD